MKDAERHHFQQVDVNSVPRSAQVATLMRARSHDSFDGLDIALAGVPFDGGSSFRAGARHGPAQMREMSRLIRAAHYATGVAPFDMCRVADVGDAPVNPLDVSASLESIESFFAAVRASGALPLVAGGDHTITLPILRAIAADAPVGLLQIDAHSDTQDRVFGQAYANGTPIRRAIEEGLVEPRHIVQIGIRGTLFSKDELDWARAQGVKIVTIDDFYELGVEGVIGRTREAFEGLSTYVTVDMDALDPAFAPGVGGLEPGGMSVRDVQLLLRGMGGLDLVGADVNEVSPPLDPTGNTALVACNLMFELLCLLAEKVRTTREDPECA
jgi:guanidinopropionase